MKKPMKKLVFLFLALLLAGCQFQLPFTDDAFSQSGDILLQDDFTGAESGWFTAANQFGLAEYTPEGLFRIRVDAPEYNFWSTPGLDVTNVIIEVDSVKLSGPEINRIGLLCRYQDAQNYYFFIISTDGYYAVGKVQDGQSALLAQSQMERTGAVLPGAALNHLRGECVGDTLIFYVNQKPVAIVNDPNFTHGDVGLLVGAFDEPGIDVYFDNFIVTKP